jgi:MFS family permease
MAAIAWSLEEMHRPVDPSEHRFTLEWRVLVVSLCVFLCSFGYGGVTSFSAMYAEAAGISPRAIYLTSVAAAILLSRPFAARLGDRFGYRRVFLPSMIVACLGLAVLAVLPPSRATMIASGAVFGAGYGTAWPVFMAYMLGRVDSRRRGAAYGAMIAALDTGIGTGSTALGWIIQHYGYAAAFGFAAALSSLAVPYFLVADRATRPPRE